MKITLNAKGEEIKREPLETDVKLEDIDDTSAVKYLAMLFGI